MAKETKEILTRSGLESRAAEAVNSRGCLDLLVGDTIEDEKDKIASTKGVVVFDDNSEPGYGVTKKNMSCFGGKGQGKFDMNYNLLRQIWYGLNYAEIKGKQGVPHEMLSAMNTFEVLSLYRAFAKLVEHGYVEVGGQRITREQLNGMDAEKAASKMVGYGCRHQAITTMRKRGCTHFPTGRGDLIKRIKALNQQVKGRFKELLDSQRRTTEATVSGRNGYDFHDPCYSGRDARRGTMVTRGALGKKKYIAAISGFMKGLYERNTQQKA